MKGYVDARGYTCLAPAWQHKDQRIAELRRNPPLVLAGLGVTEIIEIVDYYEGIIRGLDESPSLIGHSFGGLCVQMLLNRRVGQPASQ